MAKRKRNSFARVGVVCVVLLVALGVIGVGYAIWSDTINITGTVNTGTFTAEVSVVGCRPPEDVTYVLSDFYVLEPPTLDRIEVTISNPEANGDYYCDFLITNTGTTPVRVKKPIEIDYGNLPVGSTVDTNIVEGQQIDPGPGASGNVHAHLPATIGPGPYIFTITFVVVQWNQYVP